MKKRIPVDQAVGMVLPHDITEIIQDEFKGCAFKKGHILRLEDVEHLRRLGKEVSRFNYVGQGHGLSRWVLRLTGVAAMLVLAALALARTLFF
mgnify:CR=1 FL=1